MKSQQSECGGFLQKHMEPCSSEGLNCVTSGVREDGLAPNRSHRTDCGLLDTTVSTLYQDPIGA